jgi:hypothetical protein
LDVGGVVVPPSEPQPAATTESITAAEMKTRMGWVR